MDQWRAVEPAMLLHHLQWYLAREQQERSNAAIAMCQMLESEEVIRLLALPQTSWSRHHIQDVYKPRMHATYAAYMTGVHAEFVLHVRRSSPTLLQMRERHPQLYRRFQADVAALQDVPPYPDDVVRALQEYGGTTLGVGVKQAAQEHGLAPTQWQVVGSAGSGEELVAIAAGPVQAASLVEIPLLQLVQQYILEAQVAEVQAGPLGLRLDRTTRIANSLCKLAGVVQRLNDASHSMGMVLFAGRRSSDKLFLVLQNLFIAQHLRGYQGTSAVSAAAIMDEVWSQMKVPQHVRVERFGRLVGTLAHEIVSVIQQLLSGYDERAGQIAGTLEGQAGPLPITPLLAHLLHFAANPSQPITALADTFGTAAFVAVATSCDAPPELLDDLWKGREGVDATVLPDPPVGTKVFDLFQVWRLDSGSYEEIAEVVISAWERRCSALQASSGGSNGDGCSSSSSGKGTGAGCDHAAAQSGPPSNPLGAAPLPSVPPLQRPLLMNSNLSSVDELLQVMQLPERIRPSMAGFGGLADGFLPFTPCQRQPAGVDGQADHPPQYTSGPGAGISSTSQGTVPAAAGPWSVSRPGPEERKPVELKLASMVMKAVQARSQRLGQPEQASAGKVADDSSYSKAIVDPRLPPKVQEDARSRCIRMAQRSVAIPECHHAALSALLAEAYHAVTRAGVLMAR